jgi:hypothetical protein
MLCRLSYCPAFGDSDVSLNESGYQEVTRIGHEKSPVFVTPGFERDSEHDRESQAQVLIGKRIGGRDAILFLFSLSSFETRS